MLGRLGPTKVGLYIGELAAFLDNESRVIREPAMDALWDLGALAELVKVSSSRYVDVRRMACKALVGLGFDATGPQTDGISKLLRDESIELRIEACITLGSLGPDVARPYLALIGECLCEQEPGARMVACDALVALGAGGSSTATAGVVACLGDEDPAIRLQACQTLGQLGAAAASQASALYGLLDDDTQVYNRGGSFSLVSEAAKQTLRKLTDQV